MNDVAIPNIWLLGGTGLVGCAAPLLAVSRRGPPTSHPLEPSCQQRPVETGQRFAFSFRASNQTYQLFYKYKPENRK